MYLWRISIFPSLDGEGGRLYPGRWNSGGRPVVYLAASPPGALIEVLVHLEIKDATLPPHYTLLSISAPDRLRIPLLDVPAGEAWKSDESITRKLGDSWLKSRRSALARVPSSIMPETFNYLLNPLHPDASRVKVTKSLHALYDSRLFRKTSGSLTRAVQ
jgi:RES domain-containing protein